MLLEEDMSTLRLCFTSSGKRKRIKILSKMYFLGLSRLVSYFLIKCIKEIKFKI